jgi:uncharacterized membrane protein
MNPVLLVPLVAAVACLVAIKGRSRLDCSKRHRRRNDALLFGTGSVAVGLLAFESNLGLVDEPVVPGPSGFVIQAALLWAGVACAALAWYHHQ